MFFFLFLPFLPSFLLSSLPPLSFHYNLRITHNWYPASLIIFCNSPFTWASLKDFPTMSLMLTVPIIRKIMNELHWVGAICQKPENLLFLLSGNLNPQSPHSSPMSSPWSLFGCYLRSFTRQGYLGLPPLFPTHPFSHRIPSDRPLKPGTYCPFPYIRL